LSHIDSDGGKSGVSLFNCIDKVLVAVANISSSSSNVRHNVTIITTTTTSASASGGRFSIATLAKQGRDGMLKDERLAMYL
jgi:hypothetical protein